MDNVEHLLKISEGVLEKKYRQFDTNPSKKSAEKFISETVLKPNKVAEYRFLPFIKYSQVKIKYHRTKGKLRAHIKRKIRPISLVAHHDALIYVNYAEKLNKEYEKYLKKNNISKVPTAYRKQLHQSNITAAKEVFDFISDSKECWIIKGDFKGFFDNLRRRILLDNICEVLGVETLELDWKAVFKSVTTYRWVKSECLNDAMFKAKIGNNKGLPYTKNRKELSKLISRGYLSVKGPNQLGIRHGTPISAVLANIYMIKFDSHFNKMVSDKNGLYRRYSDDFIVVIPKKDLSNYAVKKFIKNMIKTSKNLTSLDIEPHKTKIYSYTNDSVSKMMIWNKDEKDNGIKRPLDYLGFIFDGDSVRMRDSSVYKFHYKSKRAINGWIRNGTDREKILNNTVPLPHEKSRLVWSSGCKKFIDNDSLPKQYKYKQRISKSKEERLRNLDGQKTATQFYMLGRRYGERYSMVGYAKRAQKIMSNNNERYDVQILSQITKQVRKNNLRIHKIRKIRSKEKKEKDNKG